MEQGLEYGRLDGTAEKKSEHIEKHVLMHLLWLLFRHGVQKDGAFKAAQIWAGMLKADALRAAVGRSAQTAGRVLPACVTAANCACRLMHAPSRQGRDLRRTA